MPTCRIRSVEIEIERSVMIERERCRMFCNDRDRMFHEEKASILFPLEVINW